MKEERLTKEIYETRAQEKNKIGGKKPKNEKSTGAREDDWHRIEILGKEGK
jgi:hypothetical protein